jgi:hypothetical protein
MSSRRSPGSAQVGCQVAHDKGECVALVGVVRRPDRHGDQGDQRLVRQGVVAVEVGAQGATAHGQDDVVDGGPGRRCHGLDPWQRVVLRDEAARRGQAHVAHRGRRLEWQYLGVAGARFRPLVDERAAGTDQGFHTAGGSAERTPRRCQAFGSLTLCLALRVDGVRTHRPWRWHVAVVRVRGERLEDLPHGGHAIQQRVVDLRVDGHAVVLDPFDEVELPQRPVAVQRLGMDVGDERQQFTDAAGCWQGQVSDVVGDLHLVRPEGERPETPVWLLQGEVERFAGLVVAHRLNGNLLQPVRWCVGRTGEHLQAPDVHRPLT